MPLVQANGLQIQIEEHGQPTDPAVLLIMGLATQLVHWPPVMIESLVKAGYRVITFDNRDIGLSERLEGMRSPSPATMLMGRAIRLGWLLAPYDLSDMADDTIGILDALELDEAHLLGVSMGGMIGQIVSAKHPGRIRSFTSIMSTTNNPALPKTKPEILRAIIKARSRRRTPEDQVEQSMALLQMIGSPDGDRDDVALRELVASSVARCNYPAGVRRQIAAIVASGDLRRWTEQISVPTLVMHGRVDPLTPYQGSVDMSSLIPGSRLEVIDGMGHDLPPRYIGRINELIANHITAVENGGDSSRAA
ncbi:MAG: alpha/beta hydrolase [Woeseiaceae bacterium]|nr:alpha/beta hydrolase [Woeseiaceae bacterium]